MDLFMVDILINYSFLESFNFSLIFLLTDKTKWVTVLRYFKPQNDFFYNFMVPLVTHLKITWIWIIHFKSCQHVQPSKEPMRLFYPLTKSLAFRGIVVRKWPLVCASNLWLHKSSLSWWRLLQMGTRNTLDFFGTFCHVFFTINDCI